MWISLCTLGEYHHCIWHCILHKNLDGSFLAHNFFEHIKSISLIFNFKKLVLIGKCSTLSLSLFWFVPCIVKLIAKILRQVLSFPVSFFLCWAVMFAPVYYGFIMFIKWSSLTWSSNLITYSQQRYFSHEKSLYSNFRKILNFFLSYKNCIAFLKPNANGFGKIGIKTVSIYNCILLDPRSEVVNLWRSSGCHLDWEHEHSAGWQ